MLLFSIVVLQALSVFGQSDSKYNASGNEVNVGTTVSPGSNQGVNLNRQVYYINPDSSWDYQYSTSETPYSETECTLCMQRIFKEQGDTMDICKCLPCSIDPKKDFLQGKLVIYLLKKNCGQFYSLNDGLRICWDGDCFNGNYEIVRAGLDNSNSSDKNSTNNTSNGALGKKKRQAPEVASTVSQTLNEALANRYHNRYQRPLYRFARSRMLDNYRSFRRMYDTGTDAGLNNDIVTTIASTLKPLLQQIENVLTEKGNSQETILDVITVGAFDPENPNQYWNDEVASIFENEMNDGEETTEGSVDPWQSDEDEDDCEICKEITQLLDMELFEDGKETSDEEEATSDEEETTSDEEETTSDEEETTSDEEEATSDEEETNSDEEETNSDEEETNSNEEETNSDEEETNSNEEETNSYEEETNSNEEETNSNEEETNSYEEETNSNEEETNSNEEETNSDEVKKRLNGEMSISDDKMTNTPEDLGNKSVTTMSPIGVNLDMNATEILQETVFSPNMNSTLCQNCSGFRRYLGKILTKRASEGNASSNSTAVTAPTVTVTAGTTATLKEINVTEATLAKRAEIFSGNTTETAPLFQLNTSTTESLTRNVRELTTIPDSLSTNATNKSEISGNTTIGEETTTESISNTTMSQIKFRNVRKTMKSMSRTKKSSGSLDSAESTKVQLISTMSNRFLRQTNGSNLSLEMNCTNNSTGAGDDSAQLGSSDDGETGGSRCVTTVEEDEKENAQDQVPNEPLLGQNLNLSADSELGGEYRYLSKSASSDLTDIKDDIKNRLSKFVNLFRNTDDGKPTEKPNENELPQQLPLKNITGKY